MVLPKGVLMDRFQRFCSGSRTGPICGSSGFQPIGLEPQTEPVDHCAVARRRACDVPF
jgi:hypothetical protein